MRMVYFNGQFAPSNGQANLASNGPYDAFIMKWDQCPAAAANPAFTYSIDCDGYAMVQGVAQAAGLNPNSDWYLVEYFPGTGNPEIQRAATWWWQQPSPYTYHTNPITFNYQLQAGKYYYIKHGL